MNRKWLKLYCFLLLLALSTMLMLWQFISPGRKTTSRDYPTIREEGILRIGIQKSEWKNEAFYFDLSRCLSNLSGLEIQIQLFETSDNCIQALTTMDCDIIASPLTSTTGTNKGTSTSLTDSYKDKNYTFTPWTVRENAPQLRDSVDSWLKQLIKDGHFQEIRQKYLQ